MLQMFVTLSGYNTINKVLQSTCRGSDWPLWTSGLNPTSDCGFGFGFGFQFLPDFVPPPLWTYVSGIELQWIIRKTNIKDTTKKFSYTMCNFSPHTLSSFSWCSFIPCQKELRRRKVMTKQNNSEKCRQIKSSYALARQLNMSLQWTQLPPDLIPVTPKIQLHLTHQRVPPPENSPGKVLQPAPCKQHPQEPPSTPIF